LGLAPIMQIGIMSYAFVNECSCLISLGMASV